MRWKTRLLLINATRGKALTNQSLGREKGIWQKLKSFRQRPHTRQGYKLLGQVDPASDGFMRAIEAITGAPITEGNLVEVLVNGDQIFPAMLKAIRSATKTLNLLTFVYWKGPIAPEVATAIAERARAGVKCKVLLDALGAIKIDTQLIEEMRESGADVAWFRPVRWYNLGKLNNRTHRKILVVDGGIGFTGGVGIAEEWMGNAQDPLHWRDTHIRVEGPAVRGLQGAFNDNWLEATGEVLAGEEYLPYIDSKPHGVIAQVTRSESGKGDTAAETLFFLAIAAAQHRLWLTTAYFVPGINQVEALVAAARRGVDVRILVPGPHIDKEFVRKAGRLSYSQLLKAGVKVYEYQPTMLHAKTLVVDGMWSTVGSINFDRRSFALNDEINISFHDKNIAECLEQQFELDLEKSKQFTLRRWKLRDGWERLQEKLSAVLKSQL